MTSDAVVLTTGRADRRRWITLGVVVTATFIVALDSTVLNVAIPTILREFHTDLPTLQWVLTGYSLTFATLLVIGGRLADIYGARRMFMIGAALFGVGSFIASVAGSVPILIGGEAVIEGIGASLMMPASVSILSSTFRGHERAMAFGLWGAAFGAALSFGPVIGGWLTTDYSWRWSFRINVVVAPLAILAAVVLVRPSPRSGRRPRIDVPGAALIAVGMFLLVFGLSEGGTYGWFTPVKDVSIGGWTVWPATRAVSIVPFVFLLSAITLTLFVVLERSKERRNGDPLFPLSQFSYPSFRYGPATSLLSSMVQTSVLLTVAVFLQDGRHLSAMEDGLWVLPLGIAILIGSTAGGRINRSVGPTSVVRLGLMFEVVGLCILTVVTTATLTFPQLLVALLVFGSGVGLATTQLTNVVLTDVPPEHTGAASGANTTSRQVGAALGIAIAGTLLSAQTIRRAVDAVSGAALSADVKAKAVTQIHDVGVAATAPPGASAGELATLRQLLDHAVAGAARPALLFATALAVVGTGLSFCIPKIPPIPRDAQTPADVFEPFEVLEPGAAV